MDYHHIGRATVIEMVEFLPVFIIDVEKVIVFLITKAIVEYRGLFLHL